jgi:hypothetical protein
VGVRVEMRGNRLNVHGLVAVGKWAIVINHSVGICVLEITGAASKLLISYLS